jgi:DNA-binding CsgD family transcriptional regulator
VISPAADRYARLPKAKILGVVYGLTDAEQRIAGAVAEGNTSLQAAKALGLSEATVRTHLTRIFSKTGVSRQAELIALMHRLAVPLHDANWPE